MNTEEQKEKKKVKHTMGLRDCTIAVELACFPMGHIEALLDGGDLGQIAREGFSMRHHVRHLDVTEEDIRRVAPYAIEARKIIDEEDES